MGVFDWRRVLRDRTDSFRYDTTDRTADFFIFVVLGVVLQAMHLYEPIVELAGNGATVPLPGFGYALAKARWRCAERLLEAITGPIKATAAGVAVAITFCYMIALLF